MTYLTSFQKNALIIVILIAMSDLAISSYGAWTGQIIETNPFFSPYLLNPFSFSGVIALAKITAISGVVALIVWFNCWEQTDPKSIWHGGNASAISAVGASIISFGSVVAANVWIWFMLIS